MQAILANPLSLWVDVIPTWSQIRGRVIAAAPSGMEEGLEEWGWMKECEQRRRNRMQSRMQSERGREKRANSRGRKEMLPSSVIESTSWEDDM